MAFWERTQQGPPMTQLLEVTVDRCYNLDDRGPFATQYSCVLTYGGSTRRTQPCFGRGSQPVVFQENFVFEFTQGLVELNIWVFATQPSRNDELIGSLRVELQRVLSDGFVDSTWTLQRSDGSPAGYIRLTLQIPTYNSTQRQGYSNYTAPTAPVEEADATQVPRLYQLLPYDAAVPPQPNPNSALWSQLLPYASSPSAAPVPASPPSGYPLPQYSVYPPNTPGPSPFSGIYPPPPR